MARRSYAVASIGGSLIGLSWLADGASAAALISPHVVTAVVVIGGLAATLPAHYGFGPAPRQAQSPGATRKLGARNRAEAIHLADEKG